MHNCYIEPFHGICCSCGGSQAKMECDGHPQHCPHWHIARGVLTPLMEVPLPPGWTQAGAEAERRHLMEAMIEAED